MDYRAPKPKPHAAIEAFLSAPSATIALVDLPKFWRLTRITFIFERPPDLDDGIRLPAAIRGALGEPLRAVSDERYGNGNQIGTPFHAWFADHCMFAERWHVPKPFVIWCHSEGGKLYVEISLFGDAGIWRDDIIEAMLRIMLPVSRGGEGGISIMPGHKARRIWKLQDIFWREAGHYPVAKLRKPFLLKTLTPIVTSGQAVMKGAMPDLFFSIFARLAGLARWQGTSVADLDFASLRVACRQISAEMLFEPRASIAHRRSRTFTSGKLETGFHLSLLVRDYPDWLWPGFTLGTLTHAGYDVVHGYGRYAIGFP